MVTRTLGFSIQALPFGPLLIVSGFVTTQGSTYYQSREQQCMWHCEYWLCTVAVSIWLCLHTSACTACNSARRSLICTGLLDEDGFHTTFDDGKWKICEGPRIIAKPSKSDILYPLHVSSVCDHVVTVTEQPSVSLWHGQSEHMKQTGM